MYKAEKSVQMTFEDFNQSCGMKLNIRDEWIVVANSIDWTAVEEKYMEIFPSKRGRPALNARMALGALIIQHKAKLSDRNLGTMILDAIRRLYAQQKEMFDEKKHRVADRIVSITQPFVRPIVRGKTKTPVEFGAKYDVSIDENGHARRCFRGRAGWLGVVRPRGGGRRCSVERQSHANAAPVRRPRPRKVRARAEISPLMGRH